MHFSSTFLSLAAQGDAAPQGFGGSNFLLMILLLVAAMYFIVLRPEQRQRKERQRQLEGIQKGDKVISAGGIHGKVTDVQKDGGIVKVEVAPKVVVKFNLASLTVSEKKDAEKSADTDAEDKENSKD